MTVPRTHFVGDGCEPEHVIRGTVTIIPPEDPEAVRIRDQAHWNEIELDEEDE
jgi:hypothetical protein